jgi:hypothetical protein
VGYRFADAQMLSDNADAAEAVSKDVDQIPENAS